MEQMDLILDWIYEDTPDDEVSAAARKEARRAILILAEEYQRQGLPESQALRAAGHEFQRRQTATLTRTLEQYKLRYTQVRLWYGRAKWIVIASILITFILAIFFARTPSSKATWLALWVVFVVICATVLLVLDYLGVWYQKRIVPAVEKISLAKPYDDIVSTVVEPETPDGEEAKKEDDPT